MTVVDLGDAHWPPLGQALAAMLPQGAGQALCYAECEPGVVGGDVFFVLDGVVRYAFASDAVTGAIRTIWTDWGRREAEPWRLLLFRLDPATGRFDAELVYADAFDADLDVLERRERWLDRAYPGLVRVDEPFEP